LPATRRSSIGRHRAGLDERAFFYLDQILTPTRNLDRPILKYSRHAKPPRIRISSERRPGSVQIAVADNGIGFDMKYHDRIFGLFSRLARQEDFEGTGPDWRS